MRPALTMLIAAAFAATGMARAGDRPPRYYYPVLPAGPSVVECDVCVYGGSPGGVAAAVQAARMGKTAVLAVFNRHVGGLTSGGLTMTDLGNRRSIGGLAREFYDRLGQDTRFRPSEAETVYRAMLTDANVPVREEHRLKSVTKDGNRIAAIEMENGVTIRAKVFVDATYEGDLFARAGVSSHVGRESNAIHGETINGIQFRNTHNFVVPIDPYRVEGDPGSGLLWGVSPEPPGEAGQGDDKLQAYNFRMFLTDADDRIPFPKPAGYDPARYDLLARYLRALPPDAWKYTAPTGPVQLHKGDCNNEGAFSTDYIGGNYDWPGADYQSRERIFQDHVNYQQGLMWFLAHDERVPGAVRAKVGQWGLTPGEFSETSSWPHQLYIREGRRMVSDYVMTEKNCRSLVAVKDSVGLASYTMDSHNCRRVVIDGKVRNEGDVQIGCPKPYPIAYRSIVPKEAECRNLLVPVCLSSSHIAYGSIRMEPVFMILGQSAGTAAAFAIDSGIAVQRVDYIDLRDRLVADKQLLDWVPEAVKK